MRLVLVALLSLAFFAGCGKKQPSPVFVKAEKAPAWFMNPRADDAHHIYGVAMAATDKEAIEKALIDIISKLSLELESSFNKTAKSFSYGKAQSSSKKVKTSLSTKIEKVSIKNYQVVKKQVLGYKRHIAMVSINRATLTHAIKKELKKKSGLFAISYDELKAQNSIKRYYNTNELMPMAKEIDANIGIAMALDKNYRNNKSFSKMLLKDMAKLKKSISFKFRAKTKHAKTFLHKIQNALAKEFTIANKANSITIACSISKSSTYSSVYRFKLASVKVKLEMFERGRLIASAVRVVKQKDDASLYENAALAFRNDLAKVGTLKLLGVLN